ncbi:hypothetical protein [Actinophytocola sp.]|uniref:hypothetical protein n=1 Tax=Actinophytocola sp. TaxID=1872138 RepID=UPI00389AB13B
MITPPSPEPAAHVDDPLTTAISRVRQGSLDQEQRDRLATLVSIATRYELPTPVTAALHLVIDSLADASPEPEPEPDVIDMHEVVRVLSETYGYTAFVGYGGGATMTLYVEPVDENERCRAAAGPGFWADGRAIGYANDFYVGPDDNGATDTTAVAELGATSVDAVAELIARTVRGEVINPQDESAP